MAGADEQPGGQKANTGGGAYIARDLRMEGGTFIGRDQIINNIQQLARTAAEEAEQAHNLETKYLAQGVSVFAQRLQVRARESGEAGGPYRGLLEYRLSDTDIFFGRDKDTRELVQHLARAPLTVLHSESGAGKTSLLQAGLSPQLLGARHLPVYCRSSDISPTLRIKQTLLPNLNDTPGLMAASLRDFLSQACDILGAPTIVCILLDQFEDFFLRLDEPQRAAFARELAECLDDSGLNVCWVLSLRSEWFSNLADFRPHVRAPFENDYRLQRLTREEARLAIAEPAGRLGITFEAGLIDVLLDEVGKQNEVAPPQIQLVCTALYQELGEAKTITHDLYVREGKAEGILREYLDRVLTRDVQREYRAAARQLLQALVTSDRHRAARTHDELADELTREGFERATVDKLLPQMIDSRLLRVEEQATLVYELAHDYLVDQIEIDPEAQARKAAQELLAQEMNTYRRYQTLIGLEHLSIIEAQGERLLLREAELDLLFRSARKAGRPTDVWRNYAVGAQQVATLAALWIKKLADQDEAETAVQLLIGLPEPETVTSLINFMAMQSSASPAATLQHLSPAQQYALRALAQMESEAAANYLQTLTPAGFDFVPAGSFELGNETYRNERPRHLVRLPAFWIARAPVTVADWQHFCHDGAYTQARYWLGSLQGGINPGPAPYDWKNQQINNDQPVQFLTWYEAIAYARWLSETDNLPVNLPTEAEWERAASLLGAIESTQWALNVVEWTHSEYRRYPYTLDDGREGESRGGLRVLRGVASDLRSEEERWSRRHVLDAALSLKNTSCRVCLRPVALTANSVARSSTSDQMPD